LSRTPLLLLGAALLGACNGDDENAAPTVTIVDPTPGQQILEGISVLLAASVSDDTDGDADLIGTWTAGGRELCAPAAAYDGGTMGCQTTLAEGDDGITLTVTDSEGAVGTDTVSIALVVSEAPIAEVLSPVADSTTYANAVIDFQGQVSDAEDGPDALNTWWESDLDGELIGLGGTPDADGLVSDSSVLTAGEHSLTLWVIDSSGKTGSDTIAVTVREDNTAPTCGITAPETNSTGQLGESVTFTGDVADDESEPQELAVFWESDLDGELSSGFAFKDGTTSVETTSLSLGTHTILLTVSDDSGASWAVCSDEILFTVGDPPVVTWVSPTDGETFDEGAEVAFAATVSDGTDDPNRLTLSWSSDVDGVLNTDDATANGDAGFSITTLSPGPHTVTLRATDSDDLYAEASASLTLNGLPTAPVVSIQPDPAATGDDLVAVVDSESVDPEGDAVTYTWTWTVDGSLFAGSITDTISSADTAQGDVWAVEVTPYDSTSAGPSGAASITIDNTAPVIAAVTLTPDPAFAGDTFTCTPDAATDADGDSVTYQTAWSVDGVTIPPSSATLDDSYWAKNQSVFCTVTAWDAMDAGTPVDSNTVVVDNSLPTLDSAEITPDAPAIDDTLTCAWSGFDDADGDSDASTISWTIGGVEVGTDTTLSGVFAPGDIVVCTVTPNDAQDTGTAVSDSVVVDNTPPVLADVTLSPDPAYEGDTLTCTPGTTSDVDGHTVSTSTTWTVSGSDPGVTDTTLSSDDYDRDDTVSCTVTPNDGTDDGDPVTSNTVTISNTPPTLADATLTPDPAIAGDTFTCTPGTTADADGDTVSVSYAWSVDGSDPGETTATLDDSHWTRHQDVSCTITPSDGTDDGTPVTSNTVTVENSPPSIDSVTISPESPEVTDTLTCAYSGFSDNDGDSDQSTFAWTVGGSTVGTDATLSGAFAAGDLVTCTVTPDDGADTGTALSDSVIAENTPPEIADATLTPTTAYEGDTFTCTPGATSDDDGHTVTTSITWSVSGSDPGETGATLTSDFWDKDDVVTCTVTPNDGGDDGDPVDSNSVTVSNSAPVIASVALDPDPAAEGDTLTCTADTATDADSDTVTTTLAWTVNGSNLSHSDDTLDDSNWARDDEVVCTATPDDGTDSGTTVSSATVTIANAAPTLTGVTITPSEPQLGDTLTCTADGFSDLDGDSDQSTFEWTISGVSVGTSDTLTSGFSSGDLVTCTVTPSDGTDEGTPDSDSVAVDNTAPVLDSVTLTPDPAYAEDSFTCTPGTATDADGHSVSYTYAWSVSGSDPGLTDATLASGNFDKGDAVTCTVTPTDGADDGDPVDSNTITVSNTAPVVDSVSLSPDPAYEGDTLECAVDSSSDADGDGISYTYAWSVDGSDIGVSSFSLGSSDFDRDQAVTCTVTPSDGTDSGSAVSSAEVTISNSAPTLTGVSITPSDEPGVDDTLTCTGDGYSDADGDSDQSTFSWTISGVEVGTSDTLSGVFAAADTVTCTVTPHDGTDAGTADSATVQIENSPPVLDSVNLTPLTAAEGDTFTCTAGTATDADGHSVTLSYAWTVSGSDPGVTDTELGPEYFAADDAVICIVTPNDGTDDGDPVSSNTVTVGNTAPVLDSVTLSPDPGYEGSTLTCAEGSASDADGDSISYSYAWSVNSSTTSDTSSTLTGSAFDKGDDVVCSVTPSDSAGSGSAVDSNTVTIENTAPTITGVTIDPSAPALDDTLTCSVDGYSDDDGDSDSSTYSWTISGTEVGSSSTLSGVFSAADLVTCTVTPHDGTDAGTADSATVQVENSKPVLDSVALTPLTAYEGDTFTCTPGTATDADGHTITYSYLWNVSGSDPGVTDSELGPSYFASDDQVVCTVTPNDGTDNGDPVNSNTVTVGNTAPVLDSVTLSPDPGYEGSTLTCAEGSASDADGDSISYSYAWSVNSSTTSDTSSTLSGTAFDKGDDVVCSVTPFDSSGNGTAVDSNTVTIENTAPTITGVTIDPSAPALDDTLTCSADGYSDDDGDSDSSTFSWTISGTEVGTSETLSGVFSAADLVTCTITPHDGTDAGTADSATVQVENTLPVLDSVALTPLTAYEGDTFTCTPGTATDADGHTITYSYLWNVSGSDPGVTDSELGPSYFGSNDQVVCTVTPNDGTDNGDPVNSNTVTVGNTAPVLDSVTLSPDPGYEGSTLTCAEGSATDVDGDSISFAYAWAVNSSGISETGNALDGSSFDKGDSVVCTVTPSDSTGTGVAVDSNAVTIENTAPTLTGASIDPTSPQVEDTLTCAGTGFSDDDGDSDASTVSWTISGTEVGTSTTLSGAFVSGDSVTCTVTPSDGTDAGTAESSTVTIENTPPVLDSATLSPDEVYEGDTLTCTEGSSTDDDGDSVTYSYSWLVSSSDPGVTDSSLSSDYWGRDDEVTCVVTPNDGTDDGSPVASNVVTVGNTSPDLTSVTLSPDPGFAGDTLDCSPDDGTDVDGDSVSYAYDWTVSGLAITETSSSLTDSEFSKGDTVYCTATPTDGTDTGVAVDSNTVTIENTAPSINSVNIDIQFPTLNDTLTCSYTGYSDADSDSDQSTYEWTISGTTVGTSSTLSGAFSSGDTVTCTVTPDDGTDTGTPLSDSTQVANSPPVLASVSLTPTSAYEGDTLTCTPGSASDDDGDTITYNYDWQVNSSDPGVTGDELDSSYWGRSDSVSCEVVPDDGTDLGAAVTSNTVTILNTVPEITGITLSSSAPTTNENLSVTVSTSDEDGDGVSLSYQWLVDGSPTGTDSSTLSGSSYFSKGQTVAVEVTPSDSGGTGTTDTSSSVTVANTPPGAPDISATPDNAEAGVEDIVCAVDLDSADDDGDSVTYTWSWEVEGQVYPDDFPSATGPTSTNDTNDTVPAADTTLGSQFGCSVVPNDGEDDGDTATTVARVLTYTNVGNDAAFGSTDTFDSDELRGASVSVSNTGTLHRLALVTPATSGNVKLALYTDNGGPDQLVVGSDSAALSSGTVEIDVGATPITAGTYWILAVYDQSTDVYVDTSSSKSVAYQSMTFSSSFKPNFGIYSTITGEDYSYFLVVEEQ